MPLGMKLDIQTHDLVLVNGAIEIISAQEKLAQDLKTRLKFNAGEALLDVNYGFPYPALFQSKQLDLSQLETLFKQYILETSGVERITKFFIDFNSSARSMTITFSVEGDDAFLIENIEVQLNVWNG